MNPEEAGLLTFTQTKGKLQLLLRSPVEKQTQNLQIAYWDALSDFVLEHQGTELTVPRSKAAIESAEGGGKSKEDVKPFIQIFKSGRESK